MRYFILCVMAVLAFGNAFENSAFEKQCKDFIIKSYQEQYKDLHFTYSALSLSPTLHIDITDAKILNLEIQKGALQRNSGNLIALIQKNNTQISYPIAYTINASSEVLRATMLIKSNQNITAANAKIQTIPIENLKGIPLAPKYLNQISAKSIISAHTIIFVSKTQSKILIKKGEMFAGVLWQDSIHVQTDLQALENGAQGQIIKALNPHSKKTLRVRVIGEQKAEIL